METQSGTSGSWPAPTSDADRTSVITNRSDLIQALCDAAQLEHALCCAYLFAAFSIKRRPDEGVPPYRLADLRDWESVLLLIARQEMEHLGIVCNLLTAIGGMPYLQNPRFPVAADRYGELPALPLQRFSKTTVQRLLAFETPDWVHLAKIVLKRTEGMLGPKALSIACKQICIEMEWMAGISGCLKAEPLFPFSGLWWIEHPVWSGDRAGYLVAVADASYATRQSTGSKSNAKFQNREHLRRGPHLPRKRIESGVEVLLRNLSDRR